MPFEPRTITHTYFICANCKHEYEIPERVQYGNIYSCTKEGCNYKETFLGYSTTDLNVSLSAGEGKVGFFGRFWGNNFVQAVFAALVVFIILGALSWVIANNLFSDLQSELQEIRNAISQIEGGS